MNTYDNMSPKNEKCTLMVLRETQHRKGKKINRIMFPDRNHVVTQMTLLSCIHSPSLNGVPKILQNTKPSSHGSSQHYIYFVAKLIIYGDSKSFLNNCMETTLREKCIEFPTIADQKNYSINSKR